MGNKFIKDLSLVDHVSITRVTVKPFWLYLSSKLISMIEHTVVIFMLSVNFVKTSQKFENSI